MISWSNNNLVIIKEALLEADSLGKLTPKKMQSTAIAEAMYNITLSLCMHYNKNKVSYSVFVLSLQS